MKRLWILRHAKSSWDDPDLPDRARPLAPRGWRDAARMAEHIATADVRPALVLCSSGLRAKQTLGRVLGSLGDAFEVRVEPGLYVFDPAPVLSRLRTILDDTSAVMVVGHNPALQELVLTIADRGDTMAQVATKFPTCALAEIDLDIGSWRELAAGTGTLVRVTVPRDLPPTAGADEP